MNLRIGREMERFYQWDTGQILTVEDEGLCAEVHFCRLEDDTALVCPIREEAGLRVADVPNILLQRAEPFRAYLQYQWEDGTETRIVRSFPVTARPKPADYVYTQTEVMNYQSLEARIRELEEHPASPESIGAAVDVYMAQNPVTPEGIGALAAEQLPEAVSDALDQAKASGEFKGEPGPAGPAGPAGADGKDGADGAQGPQGEQGPAGADGAKGDPGEQGPKGDPGADGKTPVKGVDYWTSADQSAMVRDVLAALPTWTGGSY